ncbi:MAG: hypothetical protein V8R30_00570 [Clostridia bacterium]
MIIALSIILFILSMVFFCIASASYEHEIGFEVTGLILLILTVCVSVFGCVHGFIDYPQTEGTHQGVITAVDLEGKWFRRYEVYLKSGGYTTQSDETAYLVYENEKELVEKLKNAIGKEVKLHYGHDGGIDGNSCGTYHIKDVEIIEDN